MDLSSVPQHSAPRAGSLTLEQAFDCLESFGAITPQEQCQSWPAQRQLIIQELPSPRVRQTRKRKITGSGLNERYARMTADMSILVQWPSTIAAPALDVFAQQGAPTMEHTTNDFYGSADLVAEMSSPPQLIYTQAYSPLQSTRLPEQYGQVASATAQSSFITRNDTTAPYMSQGIMKSQRAVAPSQVEGAYSTPHFRFSPPGGRSPGNVENSRIQQTPTHQIDNNSHECNQGVPEDQSVRRRSFQPHVHFEDTPQFPRAKTVVGDNAQHFVKRHRKEDKLPAPSFTSIMPPSSSTTSPTMSTTVVNDARSQQLDFSEAIKSMGQQMRASASAAVIIPGLSNISSASVRVPGHGFTRPAPSPLGSSLSLDSVLMPPPKYLPQRVAQSLTTFEEHSLHKDESMRHNETDVRPQLNEQVSDYPSAMDLEASFTIEDHWEQENGSRSTIEDLDRIVGLESELCGMID
ncbi:hypothetical protein CPC16_009784 [Podila verticillata]|nr:hypothetical protein CPC16_009784 [Podila verticillata]